MPEPIAPNCKRSYSETGCGEQPRIPHISGAYRSCPVRSFFDSRWCHIKRPRQHVSQEHASVFAPESPGIALQEFARPANGELLLQKRVNSAFIGTELDSRLKQRGATALVVVGFTTDHCVSSTVRMAGNLGYRTIVVADGTATFERRSADNKPVGPEIIHQIHLLSLQGEFAEVLDADMVLSLSEKE